MGRGAGPKGRSRHSEAAPGDSRAGLGDNLPEKEQSEKQIQELVHHWGPVQDQKWSQVQVGPDVIPKACVGLEADPGVGFGVAPGAGPSSSSRSRS